MIFSAALLAFVAAIAQDPSPSASPKPTATATPSPSPSPTKMPEPTQTPKPTPTPSVQPTPKPSPSPTPAPLPPPRATTRSDSFLDLEKLEFSPRIGRIMFSGDFDAKDQDCGGIFFRAPLAGLSRMIGMESDPIGVYFETGLASVDRDIVVASGETRDPLHYFALGVDVEFVADARWRARLLLGLGFLDFGDVEGLDGGPGLNAGLLGGVNLYDRVMLSFSPVITFSDGNWVLFNELGLSIEL